MTDKFTLLQIRYIVTFIVIMLPCGYVLKFKQCRPINFKALTKSKISNPIVLGLILVPRITKKYWIFGIIDQ